MKIYEFVFESFYYTRTIRLVYVLVFFLLKAINNIIKGRMLENDLQRIF